MAEHERLRSRARRYRDLATTFVDPHTVQVLREAADDYDRRAGEIERAQRQVAADPIATTELRSAMPKAR